MRLWTLHPKVLDARGLVALWREALLAKKVLRGRTRGDRHHPQLKHFLARLKRLAAHPCFEIRRGAVRAWEKTQATDAGRVVRS